MSALERWLCGLIVVAAPVAVGGLTLHTYGEHRYDDGQAAASAERAQADAKAVHSHNSDNTALASQQPRTTPPSRRRKTMKLLIFAGALLLLQGCASAARYVPTDPPPPPKPKAPPAVTAPIHPPALSAGQRLGAVILYGRYCCGQRHYFPRLARRLPRSSALPTPPTASMRATSALATSVPR